MSIYWDESMEIGIEQIDEQHRNLVDSFNKLSRAIRSKNHKELEESLKFIRTYTYFHFGVEDAFMVKYKYPMFRKHYNEHKYFKKELDELLDKVEKENFRMDVLLKIQNKLVQWILNHIMDDDKELGKYLVHQRRVHRSGDVNLSPPY